MNTRYIGMMFLSRLRGDNLASYVDDIEHHFSNIGNEDNRLKIKKLLNHATKNVPYYEVFSNYDFFSMPIINKDMIRKDYDLFIAKNINKAKAHVMETSGSTGQKFRILQDINKRQRVIADLIYFYKQGHYNLGEPMLYAGTFPQKSTKFKEIKTNVTELDMSEINNEVLKEIVAAINKNKYKSMLSYTSFLNELLKFMDDNDIVIPENNSLKSIFTSASYMPIQTKQMLETRFNVPIIDRYSNQECGVLAQTKSTESTFVVNTASFYVEVLELDSNRPAKAGELGRIVVTDLYNYQMPLIRYDTGDLAVANTYTERLGNTEIYEIHGRVVQTIGLKNALLTTHSLNDFFLLEDFNFSTYQCLVDEKSIEVRLPKKEESQDLEQEVKERFKNLVNNEYDIIINFTDKFEMTRSNKFETIIKR